MEFKPTSFKDLFESCLCTRKKTLSQACEGGDLDYIRRVLKNSEDAVTEDTLGDVPIMASVRNGRIRVTKYLFGIGAPSSFSTKNNWSILHEAVSSGSPDMVKYILKMSSTPTHSASKDGITPLHLAVFNGEKEILKLLLAKTRVAHVSPRGKGGLTPLMVATRHGDGEMMKLLFQAGASFFEADNLGKTSLTMAKEARVLDVVHDLNVCLVGEMAGYPESKPIMIDWVGNMRVKRRNLFFVANSCEDYADSVETQEPRDPEIDISSPVSKKGTKTIEIKNSCSFDLDLGFTGGSAGYAIEGKCKKHQVNDGTDMCFWDMGLQDYLESGKSVEIVLHEQDDGEIIISGNTWATRYIEDACPGGTCMPWVGPGGVMTRVEFTLISGDHNSFVDVSSIEGNNLPASMKPVSMVKTDADAKYQYPGDCDWKFDPDDDFMYLIQVKHSHGVCENHTDCDDGEVCGTSFEGREPVHGTCGVHVDWSNAQISCIEGSKSFKFGCEEHSDLYGCSQEWNRSGYTPGISGPVCGCKSDYGLPGLHYQFPCVNTNTEWEKHALKWVMFLKKGCGSSYSYPFDDSSSLYLFKTDAWIIEYCPLDSEEYFFM